MTSIDDRIKAALDAESSEIMADLNQDDGPFRMMANSFRGNLGRWVILVYVFSLAFLGMAVWTGIEFFQALTAYDRIFWGVWLIIFMNGVGLLKMWVWMDFNRQATTTEIKRLEVVVASLLDK